MAANPKSLQEQLEEVRARVKADSERAEQLAQSIKEAEEAEKEKQKLLSSPESVKATFCAAVDQKTSLHAQLIEDGVAWTVSKTKNGPRTDEATRIRLRQALERGRPEELDDVKVSAKSASVHYLKHIYQQ